MTTLRPVKIGLLYGLDPEREYWSEEHSKVLRDEAIERLKHAPTPTMDRWATRCRKRVLRAFMRLFERFRDAVTVEFTVTRMVEEGERPFFTDPRKEQHGQ